jgi:hypothetical protein
MNAREKIAARHEKEGDEGHMTYFDREGNVEEEEAEEIRCGLGSCFSPQSLQFLASKKAFMFVFSLLAVIQGMTWAYFTGNKLFFYFIHLVTTSFYSHNHNFGETLQNQFTDCR